MSRRYIYAPLLRKITFAENVLIERVLPKEGQIYVNEGIEVTPSDKLGSTRLSYNIVDLGSKFVPSQKETEGWAFNQGVKVGRVGQSAFKAPYKGFLVKTKQGYEFRSEERDYWLLPGVWGKVQKVYQGRSVLLQTKTVNLHLQVSTGRFKSGELIVFPNPSEMLGVQYFDNYLKTAAGKIVYVGNVATLPMLLKAHELGVEGVLAGSASREVFNFAHKNKMAFGVFNGFGESTTPEEVYNFLNDITNRYVFLNGSKNILQVPVPENPGVKETPSPLTYIKKGIKVIVYDYRYMGETGVVDRTSKSSIFVKLDGKDTSVELQAPNIFALE